MQHPFHRSASHLHSIPMLAWTLVSILLSASVSAKPPAKAAIQTPASQTPAVSPVPAPAPLPATTQNLIAAQSSIQFEVKQMGVPLQGQFKQFAAQMRFLPRQLAASKVRMVVQTASVSIGTPEYDAELRRPEWFDATTFPQAIFESSSIEANDAGKYYVRGNFTLKGKTQPLNVPVVLTQKNGLTTASGSFNLPRLSYSIGTGEWADTSVVAGDVKVQFKLVFTGIAPI